MSTTHATHPTRTARGHHLHLVADSPRSTPSPRTLGRPQRVAVTLVGLTTGFLLGAWATALGGGQPGTLATLALVCLALSVPALAASRRQVRREMRTHVPVTSTAATTSTSPVATLRALPDLSDVPAQPLPHAA